MEALWKVNIFSEKNHDLRERFQDIKIDSDSETLSYHMKLKSLNLHEKLVLDFKYIIVNEKHRNWESLLKLLKRNHLIPLKITKTILKYFFILVLGGDFLHWI